MRPKHLEDVAQAQRERLFHIEFCALFAGELRRADLMQRFGIAEAAATRDISLYRALAPDNLAYDRASKIYITAETFAPLFEHHPETSLHALAEGVGDATASLPSPHIRTERPMRPSSPALETIAAVARAIHTRQCLDVTYVSISSGESHRRIAPHSLVDTGLRWHARAWDEKNGTFRDFVLTRILDPQLTGPAPHEADREADEQWMRIVPLDLCPHPDLDHPEAIATDFQMLDGCLKIKLRAPLVGYVCQAWGVDTSADHLLDPKRHQLWLRNTATLYGVESMSFAPQ